MVFKMEDKKTRYLDAQNEDHELMNVHKSGPLVSVVIPTYNRARLLRRSIQSVLNQTYPNFEIIVVDDCSRDNTQNIVRTFCDKRIRYIRHEENRGAVAARNTGIKAAIGEYIAFQDSDDEWLPKKLQKQLRRFNSGSPDLGVVYTSFCLIDRGRKTYYPTLDVKQTEGRIHNVLLERNFIDTATAVVRKECFEKVGVFERLPRLQEWGLWLRISKYYCFSHINEPLVNSYRQLDSISCNMNAYIMARKYILDKYFDEISKKPKLLSRHYFEIGYSLCINGQIEEGRTFFYKALRTYPLNTKILLSNLFSLFGLETYSKVAAIYLRTRQQYL
jgi:glycosyltransferase involved in cell wall biosynthesis